MGLVREEIFDLSRGEHAVNVEVPIIVPKQLLRLIVFTFKMDIHWVFHNLLRGFFEAPPRNT